MFWYSVCVLYDFMRPFHFILVLSEIDVVSSGHILIQSRVGPNSYPPALLLENWLILQIKNNVKLPSAELDALLEAFHKNTTDMY